MRSSILPCIAALLFACGAEPAATSDDPPAIESATEPTSDDALALQFGWTPGRLTVVETIHGPDTSKVATRTYTLEVVQNDQGLAVTYRLSNRPATGVGYVDRLMEARSEVVQRELGFPQVGFIVNDDGIFQAPLGVSELLELTKTPEEAAELRSFSESAFGQELLQQMAARSWHVWVQVWLGLDLFPGEVRAGDAEFEFGGVTMVQHLEVEHQGFDPRHPGHVRLRYRAVVDDPRFMISLGNVASGMAEDADPEKLREVAREAAESVNFRHDKVYEVSLDPHTMIPAWAKSVERTRIEEREPGALDQSIDSVETHEWTFTRRSR